MSSLVRGVSTNAPAAVHAHSSHPVGTLSSGAARRGRELVAEVRDGAEEGVGPPLVSRAAVERALLQAFEGRRSCRLADLSPLLEVLSAWQPWRLREANAGDVVLSTDAAGCLLTLVRQLCCVQDWKAACAASGALRRAAEADAHIASASEDACAGLLMGLRTALEAFPREASNIYATQTFGDPSACARVVHCAVTLSHVCEATHILLGQWPSGASLFAQRLLQGNEAGASCSDSLLLPLLSALVAGGPGPSPPAGGSGSVVDPKGTPLDEQSDGLVAFAMLQARRSAADLLAASLQELSPTIRSRFELALVSGCIDPVKAGTRGRRCSASPTAASAAPALVVERMLTEPLDPELHLGLLELLWRGLKAKGRLRPNIPMAAVQRLEAIIGADACKRLCDASAREPLEDGERLLFQLRAAAASLGSVVPRDEGALIRPRSSFLAVFGRDIKLDRCTLTLTHYSLTLERMQGDFEWKCEVPRSSVVSECTSADGYSRPISLTVDLEMAYFLHGLSDRFGFYLSSLSILSGQTSLRLWSDRSAASIDIEVDVDAISHLCRALARVAVNNKDEGIVGPVDALGTTHKPENNEASSQRSTRTAKVASRAILKKPATAQVNRGTTRATLKRPAVCGEEIDFKSSSSSCHLRSDACGPIASYDVSANESRDIARMTSGSRISYMSRKQDVVTLKRPAGSGGVVDDHMTITSRPGVGGNTSHVDDFVSRQVSVRSTSQEGASQKRQRIRRKTANAREVIDVPQPAGAPSLRDEVTEKSKVRSINTRSNEAMQIITSADCRLNAVKEERALQKQHRICRSAAESGQGMGDAQPVAKTRGRRINKRSNMDTQSAPKAECPKRDMTEGLAFRYVEVATCREVTSGSPGSATIDFCIQALRMLRTRHLRDTCRRRGLRIGGSKDELARALAEAATCEGESASSTSTEEIPPGLAVSAPATPSTDVPPTPATRERSPSLGRSSAVWSPVDKEQSFYLPGELPSLAAQRSACGDDMRAFLTQRVRASALDFDIVTSFKSPTHSRSIGKNCAEPSDDAGGQGERPSSTPLPRRPLPKSTLGDMASHGPRTGKVVISRRASDQLVHAKPLLAPRGIGASSFGITHSLAETISAATAAVREDRLAARGRSARPRRRRSHSTGASVQFAAAFRGEVCAATTRCGAPCRSTAGLSVPPGALRHYCRRHAATWEVPIANAMRWPLFLCAPIQ